ncbi:hypothetical protein SAMN06272737_11011 [Blastococcus mobilis]|uniref:Uncharacterized protein n=1 Tax=Blastococcus mobilis TaxID=1938746 RepID=A0A238WV74_9ACTN|nr:hypothetical protein SAMN06272737_11011 [Blastococcus mobilis]
MAAFHAPLGLCRQRCLVVPRRTGVRGGRHPGWLVPPTEFLDTPPAEQRGYAAAHDWTWYPRSGTTPGARSAHSAHGDEADAGRDVCGDLRDGQVIRHVHPRRGRLRTPRTARRSSTIRTGHGYRTDQRFRSSHSTSSFDTCSGWSVIST